MRKNGVLIKKYIGGMLGCFKIVKVFVKLVILVDII